MEKNDLFTVLADRWNGTRLDSHKDLVYRSDGTLFFTGPPFGLPKLHDDPRRETSHPGVFGFSTPAERRSASCMGPGIHPTWLGATQTGARCIWRHKPAYTG